MIRHWRGAQTVHCCLCAQGKRERLPSLIHQAWNALCGKAFPRTQGQQRGLQSLDPPLEKGVQREGSTSRIKKLHQCQDSNYWQLIHSSGQIISLTGQLCSLAVIFSRFYEREHTFVHLQKGMFVDFSWGKGRCLERIKAATALPLVQPGTVCAVDHLPGKGAMSLHPAWRKM